MNKVIMIGNLTRDPEQTQTNTGVSMCRFSIAVNRNYTNSQGEREVDYFNIVSWRNLADSCSRFLKKGAKVGVSGSLITRTYEADGQKRYITEISADEVEFLSPRDGGGPSGSIENRSENRVENRSEGRKPMKDNPPVEDDDLPF